MNNRMLIILMGTLRWAARISALLLVIILLLNVIGEGGPNPFHSGLRANLQFLAFLVIAPLGLLIGWRRELLGAAMTLVAMLGFYALEYTATGRLPGWAFSLFFVPPVLYLADYILRRCTGLPCGKFQGSRS